QEVIRRHLKVENGKGIRIEDGWNAGVDIPDEGSGLVISQWHARCPQRREREEERTESNVEKLHATATVSYIELEIQLDGNFRDRMPPTTPSRASLPVPSWVYLCAPGAMGLVSRLPQLFSGDLLLDGDECILGLMAKHVAEGRDFPIFFYGQ